MYKQLYYVIYKDKSELIKTRCYHIYKFNDKLYLITMMFIWYWIRK